jgi:ComEC/Rec2-related protein
MRFPNSRRLWVLVPRPAAGWRASWWRAWPWLPCAGGLVALPWLAERGQLGVNLLSFGIACVVALLGLAAARSWTPLLSFALLLSPLAWHFGVSLPQARGTLAGIPPGTVLRIEGTVRDRAAVTAPGNPGVRVLLGDATISWEGGAVSLAELDLDLPRTNVFPFRGGRHLRAAGPWGEFQGAAPRLRLGLERSVHALADEPAWNAGEAWRVRLSDRANYYLSKPAAAVYLPMVLDVRDRRSPESRDISATFRRVGVSHIFAISGMNVALIFGMLVVVRDFLMRYAQTGQGWIHARDAGRAGSVALLWAYIAVIGLPPPAVRAAIMGTLLLWTESRGTRTPPLYVLVLTGLAMLAWSPSQLYDVSFQLSFLAYAFLLLALSLDGGRAEEPGGAPWRRWLRQGARLAWLNLLVTGVVTLGLWPLIAARFGTFSWLVFAGNLLLVPVLGAVILPAAMVALVVSLAWVASAPGAWLERAVFGFMELSLAAWLRVLRALDDLGAGLAFRVPADWSAMEGLAYYAALVALLVALGRRGKTFPERSTGRFPGSSPNE